jgi:hypothetical protein
MLLPYLVLVGHLIKLVNTAAALKSQQIHAIKKQPCFTITGNYTRNNHLYATTYIFYTVTPFVGGYVWVQKLNTQYRYYRVRATFKIEK